MTEAEWLSCEDPDAQLVFLNGRTRDRKSRLFACACCRMVWPLLTDRRSRLAVLRLEEYADGTRDDKRLTDIYNIANAAYIESYRKVGCLTGSTLAARVAAFAATGWHGTAATCAVLALEAASGTERPITQRLETALLRDIFGNPFRPITFSSSWRTDTAVTLARQMYESREFSAMPILADALQDAGCDNEDILSHCRGPGPHVRGCWVIDLVLGKE